jgi:hypothetical protein
LEKKIYLSIALLLILSTPLVSAQLTIGDPAKQKLVKVTIGKQGEVHIIHEIEKSNTPIHLNTINGTLSNLKVHDINGNEIEHGISGSGNVTGITIFSSANDVDVEYDLNDVLIFKNGMWVWDFLYLETTTFILPEGLQLVYVNNTPVMLQDAKGITCHGCQAKIEYSFDEPLNLKEIQWESKKFKVGIITLTEISSFNFDQPSKSISFNVNEDNQLITLIIPRELLWNPYEVYLNDQKILKHEFFSNDTHAWLTIRPHHSGTIQIIGTSVVPEFPLFVPFFIGIAAVVLLQLKNKFNLR